MKRLKLTLLAVSMITLTLSVGAQAQRKWISPPAGNASGQNCTECDPGEYRLIVSRNVDVGDYVYVPDPPCDDQGLNNQRHEIAEALADYAEPGLGRAAGPLIDALSDQAAAYFKANVGGTVGEFMSSYTTPTAQCEIVCGIIPVDAAVTGVKYWADDGVDPEEKTCAQGSDGQIYCGIGWSKFFPAYTVAKAGGKAVCSVFSNWSADRERGATLGIYYRPVPGHEPIPIHK
jgi:hypothetical protein